MHCNMRPPDATTVLTRFDDEAHAKFEVNQLIPGSVNEALPTVDLRNTFDGHPLRRCVAEPGVLIKIKKRKAIHQYSLRPF